MQWKFRWKDFSKKNCVVKRKFWRLQYWCIAIKVSRTNRNICYLFPYSLVAGPIYFTINWVVDFLHADVKIWHWEWSNAAESTSKWQSYWQLNVEGMKEWCKATQYAWIIDKIPTDMWSMCASFKRHYIQCVCCRNVFWMLNICTMHTFSIWTDFMTVGVAIKEN